jgi:phosphohistidine phosphatase SixA
MATKQRYCFVVNHGDLTDSENDKDQGLSINGIMQAKITAQYLKNFVDKVIPDKVVIETSPYARSMTTAAQIAKTLDYHFINVNYLFTAHQNVEM